MRLQRYDQRLRRFGLRDRHLDWDISARAARSVRSRARVLAAIVHAAGRAGRAGDLLGAVSRDRLASRGGRPASGTSRRPRRFSSGAAVYALGLRRSSTAVWRVFGMTAGIWTAAAVPLLAVAGLFAIEREAAVIETARSWLMLRRARHQSRARLKQARSELARICSIRSTTGSAQKRPGRAAAQKPN